METCVMLMKTIVQLRFRIILTQGQITKNYFHKKCLVSFTF